MTDHFATDPAHGPDGAEQPARRPTAGAQAASRARRIGGRPRPRPDSDPAEPAASTPPLPGAPQAGAAAEPTDAAESAQDAGAEGAAVASRAPGRRLSWLVAGAAVVIVGVLVWLNIAVYASWRHREHLSAGARDQLLAQAKAGVQRVISYDYRHVDADAAAAAARLTGTFRQQYLDSMTKVVKPGATAAQVVVAGQVTAAGLASVDGNQATVIVFAQQTVTKAGSKQPEVDPVSVVVTVDRVHGNWLIANIERK